MTNEVEITKAGQSEAGQLLDVIRAVATDPNVDIEKVKAIFAMQRELQKDAERREFNAAMALAQAEIEPVVRNAENAFNKAKYSTLDAIGEAVDEIITRHGFAMICRPEQSTIPGCLRVIATVTHKGGFEREFPADVPLDDKGSKGEANKTPTHAWGSTATYARKYLMFMAFNVKSKQFKDADATKVEFITNDQAAALLKEIDNQGGRTFDAIVKAYSLPDVDNVARVDIIKKLPADQFADCVTRLNDRRNAAAAKAKAETKSP
jgi:hypothetical protein